MSPLIEKSQVHWEVDMKVMDFVLTFAMGAIAVPVVASLAKVSPSGRVEATETQLVEIGEALERYGALRGRYPPETVGLVALRRPNPQSPLVAKTTTFNDAWGRAVLYELDGRGGYVLSSAGGDGRFGTQDDLRAFGRAQR
ncbi:MAG: hypothetical protein ACI9U2_001309 [Bradymonadia bacterium]